MAMTIEQARALTGHTEGPWQADGSHFYGPDPDRFLIGNLHGGGPFIENLAVIAAAPDLLELLLATADKLQAAQDENERLQSEVIRLIESNVFWKTAWHNLDQDRAARKEPKI